MISNIGLVASFIFALLGGSGPAPGRSSPGKDAAETTSVARVTATVCVFGCGGPLPVDADGNVYAATFIDVDAIAPIAGLSVARLELTDGTGAVVARGTPSATLTVVASNGATVGPFSGNLAAGEHVRLWVSMRLDAKSPALEAAPPTRFRLMLAAQGGITVEATGAVTASGATG